MEKYGQGVPPSIDLTHIKKVPVAMFVGEDDIVGPPSEGRWTHERVSTTVFYQEIPGWDHSSYSMGKNMTYTHDMLDLFHKYN